jgi:hypothetical protein
MEFEDSGIYEITKIKNISISTKVLLELRPVLFKEKGMY